MFVFDGIVQLDLRLPELAVQPKLVVKPGPINVENLMVDEVPPAEPISRFDADDLAQKFGDLPRGLEVVVLELLSVQNLLGLDLVVHEDGVR